MAKAWHKVVTLRDDVKTGELSLAEFAADLHEVAQRLGKRPSYEDPASFFALTYPTLPLRDLCKDVALRLLGRSDKAVRQLELTYGGGKTHTLVTLLHLFSDPAALPHLPAVDQFLQHIGSPPPKTRVACLCFDKLDVQSGLKHVRAPDGTMRDLRFPWSVLAWQVAGPEGLRVLHPDGLAEERDMPPAEPLLSELLSLPQREGLSTLVLIDEMMMYLRLQVERDPGWREIMVHFFQYLTQAVAKVDRCAMVASLLASDPERMDETGRGLIRAVQEIFNRQREEGIVPVEKKDVAEILRRRFFTPDTAANTDAFRGQVAAVVSSIAAIDPETARDRARTEERFLASYPFHPELTEVLYSKWTGLDAFQKARGVLRTFALALRDAEGWDGAPLVGPNVFLSKPGEEGLCDALRELASVAASERVEGSAQQWPQILPGELEKARRVQDDVVGLRAREVEQAVVSVFLHSQPVGRSAQLRDLLLLVSGSGPDKIGLEKGLRGWSKISWFLDEEDAGTDANGDQLPRTWKLGNKPNLTQMHDDACRYRVQGTMVDDRLVKELQSLQWLTKGAQANGVRTHLLPPTPDQVDDDGAIRLAILGAMGASESGSPSAFAKRFIDEKTGPTDPRVRRNAVIVAVPSRTGLDAAKQKIREHLGWLEVKGQLGSEPDPLREQTVRARVDGTKSEIQGAVRQAWCVIVAVDEQNEVRAFKITPTDGGLLPSIKADPKARIIDTAIAVESLLPGHPYGLWRPEEVTRRLADIVDAFARQPRLPRMLRREQIVDTVVAGVRDGLLVARLRRPDGSARTWWRGAVDETALADKDFELELPGTATLLSLEPPQLLPNVIEGLWAGDALVVSDAFRFFSGGRTVAVKRRDEASGTEWDEQLVIPAASEAVVREALTEAVRRGDLWLVNGPASVLGEEPPPGIMSASARLFAPPAPIDVSDLMPETLADAWNGGRTTGLALQTALSNRQGGTVLPWVLVKRAINSAISTRWLVVAPESGAWPCDAAQAAALALSVPDSQPVVPVPEPRSPPSTSGLAEGQKPYMHASSSALLPISGIQDLAEAVGDIGDVVAGYDLRFSVAVQFADGRKPPRDVVARLNEVLRRVDDRLLVDSDV